MFHDENLTNGHLEPILCKSPIAIPSAFVEENGDRGVVVVEVSNYFLKMTPIRVPTFKTILGESAFEMIFYIENIEYIVYIVA